MGTINYNQQNFRSLYAFGFRVKLLISSSIMFASTRPMNLSTTTPFLNARIAGTAFTSKRLTNLKKRRLEIRLSLLNIHPAQGLLTLCWRQHRQQPDQCRGVLLAVLSFWALESCMVHTTQRESSRRRHCPNWWPESFENCAKINHWRTLNGTFEDVYDFFPYFFVKVKVIFNHECLWTACW